MKRFRALLLGVAEYEARSISSLPCVPTDLNQLATAFKARGYTVDGTESSGRIGRSKLRGAVREFLETAEPEDTLVVYLSGHGAYHKGVTYLLPYDADLGDEMPDTAVSLNAWARAIENSKAAAILFLVDACREGYTETKSITRTRWSEEKLWYAQRRQVAWIFPCAEGQVSHWVRADGAEVLKPFSIFAQALVGAVANTAAPRTLDGLVGSLQRNIAELTRKYGKPDQTIGPVTNGRDRTEPFRLFPDGTSDAQSWEQAAGNHLAWQRVPKAHEDQSLASNVVNLVRHLDQARQRAAAATAVDPWAEHGGFALRMSRQLSFLLTAMLDDLPLEPAEAALLAAAPFVYEAHWAGQLAKAATLLEADGDPLHASFDRFVHQEFPRLRRWTGDLHGHSALAWWLLHRWLAVQPGAYAAESLSELLDPEAWGGGALAAEVLSPARLGSVVRAIRGASGFFAVDSDFGGLLPKFTIAEGRQGEQSLRERLVAILLAVAHRMAIEAPFLADVIPDTLGTAYRVSPADLITTLDGATWGKSEQERIRVLTAACTHPAVEVALREHVTEFDTLLTYLQAQVQQPQLDILRKLPFRALADRVGPAIRDGKRVYDGAGTRFQLAEDKVQELLMGEQLYGRTTAAIRELYQNALDACRYRRARTEYLNRTGHPTEPWTGSIRFVRDRDENGRDYLDCIDNGIGMGRQELTNVFARAGVRFAELPKFLEEKHEWDKLDPPVAFVPNSRFGIGVLSYFMMADEIAIDTCIFGRDGQLGERLHVSIAGPGALFIIQPVGPGEESGTRVRLYLTRGVAPGACATELHEWLRVAEFATELTEGGGRAEWKPGVLASLGEFGSPLSKVLPAGESVWWLADHGMLLVDGITAHSSEAFAGAIVNLTGEQVRLSVDRTRIISLSEHVLFDNFRAALPVLLAEGHQLLSAGWLWQFAQNRPANADMLLSAILEQGIARSLPFGKHFDLEALGCFPPDAQLFVGSRWLPKATGSPPTYVSELPDEIAIWRLASLLRGGLTISGMRVDLLPAADPYLAGVLALPSDHRLLTIANRDEWLERNVPVPAGHVFDAAEALHRPVEAVCDRLRLLGYTVPDEAVLRADKALASMNLDGKAPWRTSPERPTAKEIAFMAERLAVNDAEIAERLHRLGYDALPVLDAVLANSGLLDHNLWLAPRTGTGARQVLHAVRQLGLSVAEVIDRYGDLGFDVANVVGGLDLMALDAGDGRQLWEMGAGRINQEWVSRAADRLRMSPDEVKRRLRNEDFVLLDATPDAYLDEAIIGEIGQRSQHEKLLLSEPGLVERTKIIELAARSDRKTTHVEADLRALGFEVPAMNDLGVVDDELRRICERLRFISEIPLEFEDRPIPVGPIIDVANEVGLPAEYVAERLRSAGYKVANAAGLTDRDRLLASRDLDNEAPWLRNSGPVAVWHLLAAAIRFDTDPQLIARRMRELGYEIPEGWG